MQAEAFFLLALARGIWSFDPTTAAELTPLADRVLAGESPTTIFSQYGKPVSEAVRSQVLAATPGVQMGPGPRPFRMGWYTDLDKVAPGSIAVISVQGIILKNGMCGIGSMERAERILEAANHPNVAAILLDTDTPGGEVAGLSTVNDAVLYARQLKPVLGFINDGDCYSAGYHTLSACTEIWASHKTCNVGSIGTMCQFTDSTEADKLAGRKRVAVYATDSTDKNATFRKALAGDYRDLVAELDRLNADFQARILATRRGKIKDTKAVFTGKTFGAAEGLKLGLIDTIGSMQLALARCAELAKVPPPALPAEADDQVLEDSSEDPQASTPPAPAPAPTEPISPNSSTMKQFPLLAALGGFAPDALQSTAQGSYLQTAHLEAVEAQLASGTAAAQNLSKVQAERDTAQAALTAAQADVTAKDDEITKLKARVAGAPAAAGTKPQVHEQEQDPKPATDPAAATAWDDLDKQMLQELNG